MHVCYCFFFLYCTYTRKCYAAAASVPLVRQQWYRSCSGSASGTPTPNQMQLYINTQYDNLTAGMTNTSTISVSEAQC